MKAPKIDVGEPKELIRNEYRQRLGLFIDEKNEESNLIKDRMSDRMFREINSDISQQIIYIYAYHVPNNRNSVNRFCEQSPVLTET